MRVVHDIHIVKILGLGWDFRVNPAHERTAAPLRLPGPAEIRRAAQDPRKSSDRLLRRLRSRLHGQRVSGNQPILRVKPLPLG